MAEDEKISQSPELLELSPDDFFPVVQVSSGRNKRVPFSVIASQLSGFISSDEEITPDNSVSGTFQLEPSINYRIIEQEQDVSLLLPDYVEDDLNKVILVYKGVTDSFTADIVAWSQTLSSAQDCIGFICTSVGWLQFTRSISQDLSGFVDISSNQDITGVKSFVNGIDTSILQAYSSAGVDIKASNGTSVAVFGVGDTSSWTFKGNVAFDSLTATTVPYLNSSKVLTSSAVTPTELSYVSGVTSSIQTQINAKVTNGSLTNGYVLRFNGSSAVDSILRDNGTAVSIGAPSAGFGFDLKNMLGFSRPWPTVSGTPSGTGSYSGGMQWLDNGVNIAGLYIYKPYTNGGTPGWYQILDSQNPTFSAFSLSTSAMGINLATMTNSYSTAPTNTYNPEIKFITVGSNRGIGMWQTGSGYQFLNPYQGDKWVCVIGNNGYLRDWDNTIIASVANGGKGNGNSTLVDVQRSWRTKIRFRAMANTNSPYYYVAGIVSVDDNGNCTSVQITQPSSNTSAFNAVITSGKLQFTSNGSWDGCTIFCEKLTAQYGNQYSLWESNETFNAAGTARYWNGSGGFGIDNGLMLQSTGSNKRIVDATLVDGEVTVSNTTVTANTRYFITYKTVIGHTGHLAVVSQVNNTSFTVNSLSSGSIVTNDDSVITIMLVEVY